MKSYFHLGRWQLLLLVGSSSSFTYTNEVSMELKLNRNQERKFSELEKLERRKSSTQMCITFFHNTNMKHKEMLLFFFFSWINYRKPGFYPHILNSPVFLIRKKLIKEDGNEKWFKPRGHKGGGRSDEWRMLPQMDGSGNWIRKNNHTCNFFLLRMSVCPLDSIHFGINAITGHNCSWSGVTVLVRIVQKEWFKWRW